MTAAFQGRKRILVIDDNFSMCEKVSMILAADGYLVSLARNGAEALQRLRGPERPEIILLDLKMPVMDGCTFCEQLRQSPELAGIPIVVVSGLPDGEEQAAKLGATAYLPKPLDTVQLLATLRSCRVQAPTPAGTP